MELWDLGLSYPDRLGGSMQVGDLVRCKYSIDKPIGVVMETRKIANSLAIKVWSPDREEIRWYPSKEYEVICEK